MILVLNHCLSFFFFFMLVSRASVGALQLSFPQAKSGANPLQLSGAITVQWDADNSDPTIFTLTLFEDDLPIKSRSVRRGSTQMSEELTFTLSKSGVIRVAGGTLGTNSQNLGSSPSLSVQVSSESSRTTTATRASSRSQDSSAAATATTSATPNATTSQVTEPTAPPVNDGGSGTPSDGNSTSESSSGAIPTQTGITATNVTGTVSKSTSIPNQVQNTGSDSIDAFPTSGSASPSSPVAASNNGSSSKVGIIVGAVLGVIVFLGLMTCTTIVLLKRCNRKRAEQLLIKDMFAAAPSSQRSSVMTRVVDDEEIEKQLLEWKYGPGGLGGEAGVQRRLQEWKDGRVSGNQHETPQLPYSSA